MDYREAIDWLYSTQLFGIKLGLEAPRRLLREFLAFPAHTAKVIHVAGTNGKGSTCAMIDGLARALGERPGLFTSPHLIDYRERICVNTVQISEEKTARLLTELRELVADWDPHPTFFELTLAVAMRHFRDEHCNLIILETGMGGRLDATTAVPADVCVLTPIAMDHAKWLGNTLSEIATEKAGIAVTGKPLISAAQEPEAALAIEQQANEIRAPITWVTEPLLGYPVSLPGVHQRENAALACEAMAQAGFTMSYDVVQYGLSKVQWPGRFEEVSENLILDAAHNPHSAQALVATWQERFGQRQAEVIYGSVADKETHQVLEILSPLAAKFHFVPVNSPRSLSPEDLAKMVPGIAHEVHAEIEEALAACTELALVTGSLFLLGEVKAHLAGLPTRASSQ